MEDVDTFLREGIDAVRAGQCAKAKALLCEVIKQRPNDVNAWLWLSGAVDTDDERRFCLERVLAIEPKNSHALKGLERLSSAISSRTTSEPSRISNGEFSTSRSEKENCPHCGATIQRGKRFCAICGVELATPVGTRAKRQQHEVVPAGDESPARKSAPMAKTQRQAATRMILTNQGQLTTLLGAVGLVVGALLPWVTVASVFGSISVNGYEGDGIITGGIGLLILISALLTKGKAGKRYSVASAILGVIATLLVFWKISDVGSLAAENTDYVRTSVGSGLYLSAVGTILIIVGGLQRTPKMTK